MNLPSCCFCGKPVLEVVGIRETLTLDQLGGEERLRASRSFGQAHGGCLLQSGDGPLWSHLRFQYLLEKRKHVSLGRGPSLTGTYLEALQEYRLFWDTGYSVTFRQKALEKARRVLGGVLVPGECEYNMEIIAQGDLLDEMRKALKDDGRYPVDHFLERLRVKSLVPHPQVLPSSYFEFDQSLEQHWQGRWVSCLLKFKVFVPDSGLELLDRFGSAVAKEYLMVEVVAPRSQSQPGPLKSCQPKPGRLPNCCFCGEPVLKLEGQYAELKEEMLASDDFPLRREGAFGLAHTSCLRRTGMGYPWSLRIRQHLLQSAGLELTAEINKLSALWDPERQESHLLWEDGYQVRVSREELQTQGLLTLTNFIEKSVLPRRARLELDPSHFPRLEEKLRAELSSGECFPLWDLIKELGIAERMILPKETLRDGFLKLERVSESGLLCVVVDYLAHLPSSGVWLANLGGYPVANTDAILRSHPHLRSKVKSIVGGEVSADVLIDFLTRFESVDPTVNAPFRVPKARTDDMGVPEHFAFRTLYQTWYIDEKMHCVYRIDARDYRPIEEYRTDHFLQRLLHSLPEPPPRSLQTPSMERPVLPTEEAPENCEDETASSSPMNTPSVTAQEPAATHRPAPSPGVKESGTGLVILTPRLCPVVLHLRPAPGYQWAYQPEGETLLTVSGPPGGTDTLTLFELTSKGDRDEPILSRVPEPYRPPSDAAKEIVFELAGQEVPGFHFTTPGLPPRSVHHLVLPLAASGDEELVLIRSSERFRSPAEFRDCELLRSLALFPQNLPQWSPGDGDQADFWRTLFENSDCRFEVIYADSLLARCFSEDGWLRVSEKPCDYEPDDFHHIPTPDLLKVWEVRRKSTVRPFLEFLKGTSFPDFPQCMLFPDEIPEYLSVSCISHPDVGWIGTELLSRVFDAVPGLADALAALTSSLAGVQEEPPTRLVPRPAPRRVPTAPQPLKGGPAS